MADLFNYDAGELLIFILVLVRISGIIATAPMLGSNNIPVQIKAVLILILGLIIQPFIDFPRVLPNQPSEYVLLIFSELLIGLVMGLVGRFMFAAIEFAGTVVGFQMGLSMANMFDPMSQQQISMLARFETAVAMLVFLVMDLHLVIVQAMVRSYSLLPPGGAGTQSFLFCFCHRPSNWCALNCRVVSIKYDHRSPSKIGPPDTDFCGGFSTDAFAWVCVSDVWYPIPGDGIQEDVCYA